MLHRSHIKHVLCCLNFALEQLRLSKAIRKYKSIIQQGGDADRNSCVVGSVLGAYFGMDLVSKYFNKCKNCEWLNNEIENFVTKS